MEQQKIQNSTEFYNSLSESYDSMTRDRHRWKTVSEQYAELFSNFNPKRILDAGCGSGGEALMLAGAGFEVIGIDTSPKMINIAREKARKSDLNVVFWVDDIKSLDTVPDQYVDMVICRGNTLPHLISTLELERTFSAFKRVLSSGGKLLLQWLNYENILSERKRLVGITGAAGEVFVRFYDFNNQKELVFNLLALNRSDSWQHEWLSTRLRPWVAEDVERLLIKSDWSKILTMADLKGGTFNSQSSRDVVVMAVNV